MGLLYRVSQFWHALGAVPSPTELDLAQAALTPPLMEIFLQMQPGEQAHSLRLLQALQRQGQHHPDLMTAALLHDAGKSLYPLHLWERVLIVLVRTFLPAAAYRWGQDTPKNGKLPWLLKPFIVAEQHPAWGAALAQRAGASPLAVALIRRHQDLLQGNPHTEEDRLLLALQRLDNQN